MYQIVLFYSTINWLIFQNSTFQPEYQNPLEISFDFPAEAVLVPAGSSAMSLSTPRFIREVELCSSLEYFLQKLGLLAGQKLSTSWRDSIEKDKRDGKQLNGASEKAMHAFIYSAKVKRVRREKNILCWHSI